MAEGHEHYESLAVSHVMGGLDQQTASAFRRHLVGCVQCKAQVAELRALAGSLEDAAREERAVLALQTRARREVSSDDDVPEAEPRAWPRRMLVAVALAGVALVALMTHNLHLQATESSLRAEVERQEGILSGLASALPMATDFSEGTSGIVMADGERVSWSIADLPVPRSDQQVVVWLLVPDEQPRAVYLDAADLPDGQVAGTTEDPGATELRVTLEDLDGRDAPTTPGGTELASTDLTPIRQSDRDPASTPVDG